MLNGKSILVTGGTGSFGKSFVKTVIEQFPDIKRLVVFSRDELKQYELADDLAPYNCKALRWFLGDIRDADRLRRAFEDVDIVIHAAALKQVPAAEYNPFECIKTNILGSQNVIEASLDCGVKRVIALSTDKAAAPANLYGATKLCADKLFVAGNNVVGKRDLKLSVVRYGNVMGSRGSVIPFFLEKRKTGVLPITDERMTRFNISIKDGVKLVLWAIENAKGGEIFVPKIPSYKIGDLADAIGPDCIKEIVGIRPGEKLHEDMITTNDSYSTVDLGDYYAILPSFNSEYIEDYCKRFNAKPVEHGFHYSSNTNEFFLSREELVDLLKQEMPEQF